MCVTSYVGDYWGNRLPEKHDWFKPIIIEKRNEYSTIDLTKFATKEEIAALRKEMEELKELLKAAVKYDREAGEPNCEQEEKIALIKKVADLVGVDLKGVFD